MEQCLNSNDVDMSAKDKLKAVKKYLETGKVETRDSLDMGIDPWTFPNFGELYVKRLTLIIEELIDGI
jgi:hypothetical protein